MEAGREVWVVIEGGTYSGANGYSPPEALRAIVLDAANGVFLVGTSCGDGYYRYTIRPNRVFATKERAVEVARRLGAGAKFAGREEIKRKIAELQAALASLETAEDVVVGQ